MKSIKLARRFIESQGGFVSTKTPDELPKCSMCGKLLSAAQVRASMQQVGKVLCDEHRVLSLPLDHA